MSQIVDRNLKNECEKLNEWLWCVVNQLHQSKGGFLSVGRIEWTMKVTVKQ
jgi:hypothetical protein